MSAYKVGQELYYEYGYLSSNDGKGVMVQITKVGRTWLHLSNNTRISIATLAEDAEKNNTPGHCYLSREARETDLLLLKCWRQLVRDIDKARPVPDGVTFEDIGKARELLRLGA